MSSCSTNIPQKRDESFFAPTRGAIDARFLKTTGKDTFTGNELLLKGALEAGVSLITGYPGSPVSDIFDVVGHVAPYLADRGVVAQMANNEALATARLNGARQAGLRAMAVMKSVGFHVGADALATGNLMETHIKEGGAMVVVGDDPWNETTQINSDSRYLSKHLHMPILEPSTFQEIKDWVARGFELSGESDLYLTYLITTNQADGGGAVDVYPHPELSVSRRTPTTLSSDGIKISDSVLIPPHTSMREATLADRKSRLIKKVRELGINKWHGPNRKRVPVGFITSGLSYSYLEEVLQILGLWDTTPILKLGLTYPIDPDAVRELASKVAHLVVVEEKRGFIEEQVAELLFGFKQSGQLPKVPSLWGKRFPDDQPGFPSKRGLNASIILNRLGPAYLRWRRFFPALNIKRIETELADIKDTKKNSHDIPLRLPTFCPGCPHRDSAVVSKKMKSDFKTKENPVDVIFHGESGCHSMLQFSPYEGLMQNYSGMGVGGGTGAGMSPFVTNPQVVFLGDSTFFHSGMIAVSDAIKNNQKITFVILQNDTTAMTGHQPTPGNTTDVMREETTDQDIETLLKGMFRNDISITRTDPSDRLSYEALLKETVLKPGVKVIIADKECAITFHRRKSREKKKVINEIGYLPKEERMNVTPDVCENCLECTRQTACPGLTTENTKYGPKITTDLSTCVDDGACARTKACPSFEKVVIKRKNPMPASPLFGKDFSTLSQPLIPDFKRRWCSYTAGVGGMGAGLVNAVLVRAGFKAGYHVSFLDKKGLAIRNGGVYGHVLFSKTGPVLSPVIPYGKADLLIGLDILEAARALDAKMNLRVAHPKRTNAVVNEHKNETVLSLLGQQDFKADELHPVIRQRIRENAYHSLDFSKLSEENLGSKLYANMMIVGYAFQKGLVPIEETFLLEAIRESVKPMEIKSNELAFQLGRYFATHPEKIEEKEKDQSFWDVVAGKEKYLSRRNTKAYRALMNRVHHWIELPKDTQVLIAHMVYDLIRYENVAYAETYLTYVWNTYQKDRKEFGYAATHAVVRSLFHVMAIKDEVWVAALLTSPEKYQRDRERYKIDSKRGDKVSYVHYNRPRFTVFGRSIEFNIETRDWMLRIMRHAKFLRRWLPEWHKDERKFRQWYYGIVRRFDYFESSTKYDLFVEALKIPLNVRGYREIRKPAMDQAVRQVDFILSQVNQPETKKTIPIKDEVLN